MSCHRKYYKSESEVREIGKRYGPERADTVSVSHGRGICGADRMEQAEVEQDLAAETAAHHSGCAGNCGRVGSAVYDGG